MRGRRPAVRHEWPKSTNHTPLDTPCREWFGARTEKGYGTMQRGKKHLRVHRHVWSMLHGPIPDGMIVLHRCDNPACFRLEHLSLGTPHDNSQDMANKGRAPKAHAVLSAGDVVEIRSRLAAGERVHALARRYGMSPGAIYDINHRRTWKDVA